MFKIEYWPSFTDVDRIIGFGNIHLKTSEDLKLMFFIFQRYETKILIKVDVTLARSKDNILKMLKHPSTVVDGEIYTSIC